MSKSSIGNDLYTGRRSFPFIAKRKYWFAISIVLIAVSVVTLVVKGLNLGIEFTGGSQFTISQTKTTDQNAAVDIMRTYAKDNGARVVQVGDSTLRIQTSETKLSDQRVKTVRSELAKAYHVSPSNVASTFIGPTWGQDISSKALQGFITFLVAVALGLTLYFRSWRNAAGAILALFNDLIITIGVYALFGFEVTPSTIIGLLTILGYSLYDTVVVFDKVRENSSKLLSQTEQTFGESVNLAVNQTLIRSLNTSITSLLPVISILFIGTYLLGAGTLRDLALVMFVGMILSTLSSMFIASPIAVQLAHFDPKIRRHTEKVEKLRKERRAEIAERRASGEEISSEEEEEMVVHTGHVIRQPGRHLGTSAQPHRKNRKKK